MSGTNYLLDLVRTEVEAAIYRARDIPVSKDLDRVRVTPEISSFMQQVRSDREIRQRVKKHCLDIEKALNYRKSALIMMNHNYDDKLVRRVEPVRISEARTVQTYK